MCVCTVWLSDIYGRSNIVSNCSKMLIHKYISQKWVYNGFQSVLCISWREVKIKGKVLYIMHTIIYMYAVQMGSWYITTTIVLFSETTILNVIFKFLVSWYHFNWEITVNAYFSFWEKNLSALHYTFI